MSAAGHVDGRWTPIGARTMALARQYNLRHAADSATKGPSVDDEVLKHRTAARGRHIDWCVLPRSPPIAVPCRSCAVDLTSRHRFARRVDDQFNYTCVEVEPDLSADGGASRMTGATARDVPPVNWAKTMVTEEPVVPSYADPAASTAWHTRACQQAQRPEARGVGDGTSAVYEAGCSNEPVEGSEDPPTRRQLLSLVSHLQDQLTRARIKQEDLSDSLHTSQVHREAARYVSSAAPAPLRAAPTTAPNAPPPRVFLGGASRPLVSSGPLAAPYRAMEGRSLGESAHLTDRLARVTNGLYRLAEEVEAEAAAVPAGTPSALPHAAADARLARRAQADLWLHQALAAPYQPVGEHTSRTISDKISTTTALGEAVALGTALGGAARAEVARELDQWVLAPKPSAASPRSVLAETSRRAPLPSTVSPPRCGLVPPHAGAAGAATASTNRSAAPAADGYASPLPSGAARPPLTPAAALAVLDGYAAALSPSRQAHKRLAPPPPSTVIPDELPPDPRAAMAAVAILEAGLPPWGGRSSIETSAAAPRDAVEILAVAPQESARYIAHQEALRLAVDTGEKKLRDAMAARIEAEQLAADAARSSAAASKAAEDLRTQLIGARRQASDAMETTKIAERRTSSLEAEVAALRAQLARKHADEQALQTKLAEASAAQAQQQSHYARREKEMRAVQQRALAMVKAMRGATQSLSAHSQAHALLERHFREIEGSLSAPPPEEAPSRAPLRGAKA